MRFLSVNLDALLVELDDLPQTLALLASLQAEPVDGIEEIVPAARTLLVRFRPARIAREALIERIGRRSLAAAAERDSPLVEIPVEYDGEDLDEVALLLGVSPAEVVRMHTESHYTVAFTGFAPGFAYLSGGDPRLEVPRRATPRTRIPAGAVGLAGRFSGVYPHASPGGWQIIGVTRTPMWDLARAQPALLQPGFRVRFVDAAGSSQQVAGAPRVAGAPQPRTRTDSDTGAGAAANADAADSANAGAAVAPALEIRATGLQALFQDLGRQGLAGQGVSASGAMDRAALRSANRLVGNASDEACVEIVYGGFALVSRGDTVVAFAGADAPIELQRANGQRRTAPSHAPIALEVGDALLLGEPRAGIRSYLALRGGFAVAPVLGSRSTDTLAHIGPKPIAAGDLLAARPLRGAAIVGPPEAPRADLPSTREVVTLDVVPGPRTDWFTAEAIALLGSQSWKVTPQSNRVGLRLAGAEPLARARHDELPSEGTALGAIQVPASGQPVLFLADHPLTGGYPVIGAVAPYHIDRAGQIPIGAELRFRFIQDFLDQTP